MEKKEGEAIIDVPEGKISKKLPVFYNPVMKLNRDITVDILKKEKPKQIGLPLAGSGIRGIRILKEVKEGKVFFNDISENAANKIKENIGKNNIKNDYSISNMDANLFLAESQGFDYIDIDPFGTPNPFLDNSIRKLSRDGILAVTATDTSALCGTYPKACMRKYWARSVKGPLMHETGLRILIRKIQLIGAQNDKALAPILSYSKDHYMRVFLRCKKSKKAADEIIEKHGHIGEAGPLWKGRLKEQLSLENEFAKGVVDEADTIGFIDLHELGKKNKIKELPKMDVILEKIRNEGYTATRTHFSDTGIKTNMKEKEITQLLF